MTGQEVDKDVRQELRSLPKTLAEDVARNLVMAARLLDEEPEQAYAYAKVAHRLASRVAAVREAMGFAAYANEKYSEALAEFRAARRMSGSVDLWPVMADCERGLGRPERALAMAGEPEVQKLDKAGQVEMRLVAAGARRDLGQHDAALVTLRSPELASTSVHPWTARLRYAYADALLALGREDEAREWFGRALEADQSGSTDASDRLAELDGVEFIDALDPDAEEDAYAEQDAEEAPAPAPGEAEPLVAEAVVTADAPAADPGQAESPEHVEAAERAEIPERVADPEHAAGPPADATVADAAEAAGDVTRPPASEAAATGDVPGSTDDRASDGGDGTGRTADAESPER